MSVAVESMIRSVAPSAREAVQLEIVPHRVWDDEAAGFADISYEQTTVFTATKWGPERIIACRVNLGRRTLGGAVVTHFSTLGHKTGLYFIKFGPVWRRAGEDVSWENYRCILRAFKREFCDRRGGMLVIVPRPHPDFAHREAQGLTGAGFCPQVNVPDPNRYLVDLHSPGERLAGLSQKWRYNLKQALKSPLSFQKCDAVTGYAAFAELHRAMVARKRFPQDETIDVIPRLDGSLPSSLRPEIYLAHVEGRIVAGAVIGKTGDIACYLYGASVIEATSRNAGYALQWHVLEQLRRTNQRWYDLGGEALDQGLRQFKRGLVGRQGVVLQTPGEFRLATRATARIAGVIINAIRTSRRTMRHVPRFRLIP